MLETMFLIWECVVIQVVLSSEMARFKKSTKEKYNPWILTEVEIM